MSNLVPDCYEVKSRLSNFYSGAKITWTENGQHLYCQNSCEIFFVSVEKGKHIRRLNLIDGINHDNDILITFDISNDNKIITAHKSGLLKVWNLKNENQLKKWKSNHMGPITTLRFRSCNKIVCSAAADYTIRVWDYLNSCCISKIKLQGLNSVLNFDPECSSLFVYSSDTEYSIRCWDYSTGKLNSEYKGHISHITDLAFEEQNMKYMASVSVDKVLILWDRYNKTKYKVLPLYEPLQGVFFLFANQLMHFVFDGAQNNEDVFVMAVGVSGSLYVIDCSEDKIIYTKRKENIGAVKAKESLVTQLIHSKKTNQFALVTADHNISFFDVLTLECSKNIIGYNNEILDMCFLGAENQYLAVATNSTSIKIYDTFNMNCRILSEHLDTVLTIAGLKNNLISAGKDMVIIIWKLDPVLFTIRCVQKCIGHTSPIGSITLSCQFFSTFASVSQDGCLKLWKSPETTKDFPTFKIKNSIIAHSKEINCVAFSPNNSIIASASQDNNIKIWKSQDLSLIHTLRGHRRGVWTVRFSPVDQILISSSSDCTIRIWCLSKLICLSKIDEQFSVLRVEFSSTGNIFFSATANGLIKVRNLQSTGSHFTLDEHIGRVWALAIHADGSGFYSGGSDSVLIYWKNVSNRKSDENIQDKIMLNKNNQSLNNLIKNNYIEKALPLTLLLNNQFITLKIISHITKTKSSEILNNINYTIVHINNFLTLMKSWNTNARYCQNSQLILSVIINKTIQGSFEVFDQQKLVEDLHTYTERHYKRMCLYIKELQFLDFSVKCM